MSLALLSTGSPAQTPACQLHDSNYANQGADGCACCEKHDKHFYLVAKTC